MASQSNDSAQRTIHIKHPDRLFIGGEWIVPSTDKKLEVRDSHTENVFLTVADAQVGDIDRAVAAARDAFDNGPWPRMSHHERGVWMNKIADEWDRRTEDLSTNWVMESGVLHAVAKMVPAAFSASFREHAALADTFDWEEKAVSSAGNPSLRVREPVGVVGAIIPWNGALGLMVGKVAPALIAGCTVIIKGSPEAPAAPYILAEICEAIGLPKGVINVVTADREASERLVSHPGVDKISFTGSTATGRRIGAICGERVARLTTELGGKSPAIILDDYDLAMAAGKIVRYAVFITGQVCSSLTRLIVTDKRHDEFAEILAAQFSQIKVGDPFDPSSQMGPLSTERLRDRVLMLIGKGKEEGARLMTGGGRPAHLPHGYYIEPTVFADVDNHSTIAREEIFGPVLSVIRARDEQHAIELANDTIYGLNASVFTNNADKAYTVGRQIRAGTVGHNEFKSDLQVGAGGFKASGIGRKGGIDGLFPYLETKSMIFDTMPSHVG